MRAGPKLFRYLSSITGWLILVAVLLCREGTLVMICGWQFAIESRQMLTKRSRVAAAIVGETF